MKSSATLKSSSRNSLLFIVPLLFLAVFVVITQAAWTTKFFDNFGVSSYDESSWTDANQAFTADNSNCVSGYCAEYVGAVGNPATLVLTNSQDLSDGTEGNVTYWAHVESACDGNNNEGCCLDLYYNSGWDSLTLGQGEIGCADADDDPEAVMFEAYRVLNSTHMTSDFKIRFSCYTSGGNEEVYIDDVNISYNQVANPPDPAFISPTDSNQTLTGNLTYILWNMSSTEDIGNCQFEINGTNQSGTIVNDTADWWCYYNETGFEANVTRCSRGWASDADDNFNNTDNSICITTNISMDTTPPNLDFVSPTPDNESEEGGTITINVSANEDLGSCELDWELAANESMTVNGNYCYVSKTGLTDGQKYTYVVYGNDTTGNNNVTEQRLVQYTDWWNSSFSHRRSFRFENATSTELENFPILIALNDTNFDFSGIQNDCDDIRFINNDNATKQNFEIENCSTGTNQAWFWVNVTLPANDNLTIWIYYEDADAENDESINDVWNSNFKMVHHMSDYNASWINDSTSNVNDGGKDSDNNPQVVYDQQIAEAQDHSDDMILVPDDTSLQIGGAITMEGWVNLDSIDDSGYDLVMRKSSAAGSLGEFSYGWYAEEGSKKIFLALYDTSAAWSQTSTYEIIESTGQWYYIAITWDGTTDESNNVKLYVDGELNESWSKTNSLNTNSYDLQIGDQNNNANDLNGKIDELRLSNDNRTSDWIRATYYIGTETGVNIGSEEDYVEASYNTSFSINLTDNSRVWSNDSEAKTAKSLWYNDTGGSGDDKNVNATVEGSNPQTESLGSINFTNTGNTSIKMYMQLSSALPATIETFYSLDGNYATDTYSLNDSEAALVNASVGVNDSIIIWVWANFTDNSAGATQLDLWVNSTT